jgi:hypothetical protein
VSLPIGRFSLALWLSVCAPTTFADVNIAPFSDIRSTPYVGSSIGYLVDGKLADAEDSSLATAAPLPIRIGQIMPVQYEFRFPNKVPITSIRLYQYARDGRRAASAYEIALDTTGEGRYDKVIVIENNAAADRWLEHRLATPISTLGLRFRTTAYASPTEGPNYGGAAIGEFEIYANVPISSRKPKEKLKPSDVTEIPGTRKRFATKSTKLWRDQFKRGLVGSMWQFWTAGEEYSARKNAANIALLKKLNINRYWLNAGVFVDNNPDLPNLTLPQNPEYRYFVDRQIAYRTKAGTQQMKILPFPSEVVAGYKDNVLKQFVTQIHANNIGVIVNEFPLPYGLGGWDFPRVSNTKEYPCILSSSFVRDASMTLYREFMNSGVDGLALGGDEFFLHGHDGSDEQSAPVCQAANGMIKAICKPTCRDLFEKQTGLKLREDAKPTSSKIETRWKNFEYQQLATLFAGYAKMMKSVNPDVVVTSLFRSGEENRPAYGIAYDIMGANGMVDEMSANPYWAGDSYLGHYFFANETKKLIGASLSRTAVITLQPTPDFDRRGYKNPLMVYGPAFSALMHGVSGINYYEQDYLFKGDKNDPGPWIEKFFNLTATLEDRGLAEYRAPKTVALLYSRASEDWWQLSHKQDPVGAASIILCQNAVMELLFKNAIPFDLYYLDQPKALGAIRDYALAILPCPYSMPNASLAPIQRAITKGVKMISLGHRGEVDEMDERYETPLLEPLSGIRHLSIDLTRTNYREFSQLLLPQLLGELGERRPLVFDADGADVECSVRSKDSAHWIFCLNWETQPVGVTLGLRLSPGNYGFSTVTMETTSIASLKGKSRLTENDFASFRIVLGPGEAQIIAVQPVK